MLRYSSLLILFLAFPAAAQNNPNPAPPADPVRIVINGGTASIEAPPPSPPPSIFKFIPLPERIRISAPVDGAESGLACQDLAGQPETSADHLLHQTDEP